MDDVKFPKLQQSSESLAMAANLAASHGAATAIGERSTGIGVSLAELASRVEACSTLRSSAPGCEQTLMLAFFFDGTGNNAEADAPTNKLSNVAKLHLSHLGSRPDEGVSSFYIPGIGTFFKDINDKGGIAGLAFGAAGEARIRWAAKQFKKKVEDAEALAINPRNRILTINVAAFGFSRGATLARAFAKEMQKLCRQEGSSWTLKKGGYPLRFYFLGLWDTVASVGVPMSASNTRLLQTAGWTSTAEAMKWRNTTANGVRTLAFGDPLRNAAVNPSPGSTDGHSSWADNIEIPAIVEKCVHMVAAHEIRNSFPLDSCRRGTSYPTGTSEMVYPGAHSDVGGGYRPGEGARSPKPGQMLSLIPLRTMHKLARENGVPLYPLAALPYDDVEEYFAVDEKSRIEFNRLSELWRHYMNLAETSGADIGKLINSHMRLYYGWRFHKIRKNMESRKNDRRTSDQTTLNQLEPQWQREREELEAQLQQLEKEAQEKHEEVERARRRLLDVQTRQARFGTAVDPALKDDFRRAKTAAEAATDAYLKAKARHDTLPSSNGSLARNLEIYDDQLMADAETIYSELKKFPNLRPRPHYRNLLDAYEAEFVHGRGLRDEKIIEFFDTYVHDSLAGFAQDATLPSDPRVVYIGGDEKLRHAAMTPGQDQPQAA